MPSEEHEKLREKILSEIEKTKGEIEKLKELARPVSPDNAIGRLTRMDAIQTQKLSEASLRKSRNKLDALRRALDKSKSPDFGTCQRCGNGINPKRLFLMPESPFCINCAS